MEQQMIDRLARSSDAALASAVRVPTLAASAAAEIQRRPGLALLVACWHAADDESAAQSRAERAAARARTLAALDAYHAAGRPRSR